HFPLVAVDVVAVGVRSEEREGARAERLAAHRRRDAGRLELRYKSRIAPCLLPQAHRRGGIRCIEQDGVALALELARRRIAEPDAITEPEPGVARAKHRTGYKTQRVDGRIHQQAIDLLEASRLQHGRAGIAELSPDDVEAPVEHVVEYFYAD